MKVNYPEIRYEKSRDPSGPSHAICAWFDKSHPYLDRASPVLLMKVCDGMDPHAADSLGIKKLILYLIWMLKEDAALNDEAMYMTELPVLRKLELEVETDIRALGY